MPVLLPHRPNSPWHRGLNCMHPILGSRSCQKFALKLLVIARTIMSTEVAKFSRSCSLSNATLTTVSWRPEEPRALTHKLPSAKQRNFEHCKVYLLQCQHSRILVCSDCLGLAAMRSVIGRRLSSNGVMKTLQQRDFVEMGLGLGETKCHFLPVKKMQRRGICQLQSMGQLVKNLSAPADLKCQEYPKAIHIMELMLAVSG